MQGGKRLRDAQEDSLMKNAGKEIGKGMIGVLSGGNMPTPQSDPSEKQVALTPEEQDLVKAIDGKANKAAFSANIRLVATAETHERAAEILSHMENAFSQFENPEVNLFRVLRRVKEKQAVFEYIFRTFDEEDASVLGVEEVSSIFHFPISTTETPKIKWLKAGAAPPPVDPGPGHNGPTARLLPRALRHPPRGAAARADPGAGADHRCAHDR